MRIAFCIFKYFPFGGLQRDLLRIAQLCMQRGHQVHVFTMEWQGPMLQDLAVTLIPITAWSNHGRCQGFADAVTAHLAAQHFDVVVGFNKMPGLDIYFAGDVCYEAKVRQQRSRLYRFSPRYRCYQRLEQAVFQRHAKTEILILTPTQQQEFIDCYATESERFHLLPPGISLDLVASANAQAIRAAVREEYHLTDDDYLLLMVGSGFKTKGLDRCLWALHALPEAIRLKTHFLVIGQDNPKPFLKLINQLNLNEQVKFLGGRYDVPRFLLAADLLLHPAYSETAGMVLLEALTAGLPILATEICGYSHHIAKANAGKLLPTPFQQQQMNTYLKEMLTSLQRELWRQNGLNYAAHTDLSSLTEYAVSIIERVANC